eukprot:CAMPEP_0168488238 /NCGR_PEP_ID=MMETSP0228-20121227/68047_1 /TAXON_ID=133427 /ORGANISM="Protoceratium reticulatum, Strain CCCM 535 (=CCMP 1889)" /LENGTH=78 /DNA_ID=CAMNT_0008504877 /DNA_START=122 /DNA_END=355 /DNA_ORIENTATION=+
MCHRRQLFPCAGRGVIPLHGSQALSSLALCSPTNEEAPLYRCCAGSCPGRTHGGQQLPLTNSQLEVLGGPHGLALAVK